MATTKIKPSSKLLEPTKPAKPPLEQKLAPLFGPILLLALVAVSSFLLGKSYESHLTPPTPTVAATTTESTDASAIDQITGAISNPAPAPTGSSSSVPQSSSSSVSSKASASSGIININTADLTALETLTGIGPTKAQAIIDYRTQNGPFTSVDELDKVKGIGPATIDKIRSQVTI